MNFSSRSLFMFSFLLFCACHEQAEEESAPQKTSTGKELFVLVDQSESNITFQNTLTEGLNTNILMYEYFYNGGGIATADFNNDGLIDLYFTSNMSDNKLYINRGNFKFEDVTTVSGAGGRAGPWKTGANAVDVNADGLPDIYLCYSGAMPEAKRANQLFINKGAGKNGVPLFEEKAAAFGLASTGFSNQSYFFDYDKDGDLDMLLLNHNPKNLPILNVEATAKLFKQDSPDKGLRLLKQSNGVFEDVTVKAGINGSELSYGLGIGLSDFNEDGYPDFYVSNDYAVPDFLYINNGNGTFTNTIESAIGHTSQFSMGNDVADVNNDGLPDIFTLDMLPEDNHRQKLLLAPDNYPKFNMNVRSGFYYQYMRNMLQINNGNNTFSETGQLEGVSNTDWSWAPLFADYDNDGWKDLYITNGYYRDYTNLDFINYMNSYVEARGRLQREDVMEIIKKMPSSNVVNYMFRNKQGSGFTNAATEWGMNQHSNSNGAAYADLDNDGDLDIVVNNINLPAFLYKNESEKLSKNNFINISLTGSAGNLQGIGAIVTVYSKGHIQKVEQYPARGYLSNVSPVLHFGLGSTSLIDSLIITWPGGKMQRLTDVKVNQLIKLNEKEALLNRLKPAKVQTWFSETMPGIQFSDKTDTSINDFNRQALLISQLSYNSPCMVKSDLNKDGLEDLILGGNGIQPAQLYMQSANGSFRQKIIADFEKDKQYVDAAIAILDADKDGNADIYIASGGYHSIGDSFYLLHDRLYIADGKGNYKRSNLLPAIAGSKSSVAVDDINGDGAPDIFVGGRVVPGRYPETPVSYILINDGKGRFTDQTKKVCPALATAGMVTTALWADMDRDQENELIVAGEWMPITVYKKQDGKLIDQSKKFFSKQYKGWWNTIEVVDLNQDGRPDIVAGNIGLNMQFHASDTEPLDLYYKDFDNNGSVDPVFCFYIQGKRYPYITRDELVSQLPVLRKRFADFKSYADVTLDQLFEEKDLKGAGHLTANFTATTCFMSTAGGALQETALPIQAQYAPVYTIDTLDFNKDGNKDLLLCGNNSYLKIRLGKADANYGVLLAGDGKGNFTYINQRESGFHIRGDVRSCIQVNNKLYFGICGQKLTAYYLSK
ncbi:VCBS repeat-containing protein [Panacibacter sp. DH6]|uniref:VCBS repeat-containing protein n=1 Tax=Panacibacter microcysteis TaxID=2793269 RepID=A0A931GZE4_9BACT|nr:VCBS repeat-containing protein [Panacibacter microcysteis]MBG9378181.1 VCBS repeat-containing protein [Panacibacter microcysteis]